MIESLNKRLSEQNISSMKIIDEQNKFIQDLEKDNIFLKKRVDDLNEQYNILKSGYETIGSDYDNLDSEYCSLLSNFNLQKAKKKELQAFFDRTVNALRNASAENENL